jgi:hypothetical protein
MSDFPGFIWCQGEIGGNDPAFNVAFFLGCTRIVFDEMGYVDFFMG